MKQIANDSQVDRFLTFKLGEEGFAIDLVHVVEIVPVAKLTPIPHAKNYAKGVMNLRGKVIPVLDLRMRLEMPERAYDERTCVMILACEDDEIGLVVDRVIGVMTFTRDRLEALSRNSSQTVKKYFNGIAKNNEQILPVLDLKKIIYEESNPSHEKNNH